MFWYSCLEGPFWCNNLLLYWVLFFQMCDMCCFLGEYFLCVCVCVCINIFLVKRIHCSVCSIYKWPLKETKPVTCIGSCTCCVPVEIRHLRLFARMRFNCYLYIAVLKVIVFSSLSLENGDFPFLLSWMYKVLSPDDDRRKDTGKHLPCS